MGQFLLRLGALTGRRGARASLLALAAGGSALTSLPLLGLPGYELSEALALLGGLAASVTGCAAFRVEHGALRGESGNGILRPLPAGVGLLAAITTSTLSTLLAAAIPLAVAALRAALGTPCDPWRALGFFPLLVPPSLLLGSVLGTFAAAASDRRLGTLGAWLLPVAALTLGTVWPLVRGPQVFAFHHLAGYFPGPLYDEALALPPALYWFRAQTLLLCLAAACGTVAFLTPLGRLRLKAPSPLAAASCALLLLAAAALESSAPELGFRMTDAYLAGQLGAVRDTAHFRVHLPRGKPRAEVEHLLRDLEFRYAQVRAFLGGEPAERITVWVHRDAAEKQRLLGAAATQFAKPWRRELHINDAPFPHAVVKHELVHVMAAPDGAWPFEVPARFGLLVNVGVLEGLAVAADNPVGELTLHDSAAGMRRKGLLPDLERLFTPTGFYGAAPSRAYTAAGSFLRWLGETRGPAPLRTLYARGDFEAAYGEPLSSLRAAWEAFLAERVLDEASVNLVFARFRGESLFSRPCARELAALTDEAASELRGDPDRALALYRRCAALQPGEPAHPLGEARALLALHRAPDAEAVLAPLSARLEDRPGLRAEVEVLRADAAWLAARDPSPHLVQALALSPPPGLARQALLKHAALASPAKEALWAWFLPVPEEGRLELLHRAREAAPDEPLVHYLLGRRLSVGSAPALARPHLDVALAAELAPPLREEALRAALATAFLSGDCAAVRALRSGPVQPPAPLAAAAEDWVQRCTFEEAEHGGPLVPEAPFR